MGSEKMGLQGSESYNEMQADSLSIDSRRSAKVLEPMKKVQSQSEPRKRTISNDAVRRGFTTESMMVDSQHNVREK